MKICNNRYFSQYWIHDFQYLLGTNLSTPRFRAPPLTRCRLKDIGNGRECVTQGNLLITRCDIISKSLRDRFETRWRGWRKEGEEGWVSWREDYRGLNWNSIDFPDIASCPFLCIRKKNLLLPSLLSLFF